MKQVIKSRNSVLKSMTSPEVSEDLNFNTVMFKSAQ